jgi:hypothetical protein
LVWKNARNISFRLPLMIASQQSDTGIDDPQGQELLI